MAQQAKIWARFDRPDRLAAAVRQVKASGLDLVGYAPVMTTEIEKALAAPPSKVRWFAMAGGLVGFAVGFWLSIMSAVEWNTITGGKPVISYPPFVVIAFEFTILLGAMATVLGFVLLAGLPARRSADYEPSLSEDRFALRITCSEADAARVERALVEAGAEEVRGAAELRATEASE